MAIGYAEQVADEGLEPVRAAGTVAVPTRHLCHDVAPLLPNRGLDVGFEVLVVEVGWKDPEVEQRPAEGVRVARHERSHRPRDPLSVPLPGLSSQPQIDQAEATIGQDDEVPCVGVSVEAAPLEHLLDDLLERQVGHSPGAVWIRLRAGSIR